MSDHQVLLAQADALETGATSDIWYDAAHYGEDDKANTIMLTQAAMLCAAASMRKIPALREALRHMTDLAKEAVEARRESDNDEDHELLPVYEGWLADAEKLLNPPVATFLATVTITDPD